jgi:hypothetical protein
VGESGHQFRAILTNAHSATESEAATLMVNTPSTTLTTSLSGEAKAGASITVKEGAAVTDSAILAGSNAATATGTVTYKVYSDSGCSREVASAGTVKVSGELVPVSEAKTLKAGRYFWQASYTGDAGNGESKSKCGDEILTVESSATRTCGNTSIGKTSDPMFADRKRVNKCVLPVNGRVSQLSMYLTPTSTLGQQVIKGVLYGDSKKGPRALLGVTEQLTVRHASPAGWYPLTFSAPVKLPAGRYWIGVITGATGKVVAEHYDRVRDAQDYNGNAYTSGPSNPFGKFKTNDELMSLYATYTAA